MCRAGPLLCTLLRGRRPPVCRADTLFYLHPILTQARRRAYKPLMSSSEPTPIELAIAMISGLREATPYHWTASSEELGNKSCKIEPCFLPKLPGESLTPREHPTSSASGSRERIQTCFPTRPLDPERVIGHSPVSAKLLKAMCDMYDRTREQSALWASDFGQTCRTTPASTLRRLCRHW